MHSLPALPEILALSGGLRWCKVCGLALTQQQLSESSFLRFRKTNYICIRENSTLHWSLKLERRGFDFA